MSRPSHPSTQAGRPVVEAMEPRLLYAADIAPLALAISDVGAHVQSLAPAQAAIQSAAQASAHEWVFIDAGVPDLATFLNDFEQQARQGRDVCVVVIQAGEDGVTRISQALADQQNVSAIHIISHGSDGALQLGAVTLDAQALTTRATELAQWGAALSDSADLLLYGCNVAADAQGQAFVQGLAALTGADIAASTDLTGAGGNWTLELQTGQVDTAMAVSTTLYDTWAGQLAQATGISKGQTVWSDANAGVPLSSKWDGASLSAGTATQAASNWTVVTSASAPGGRSAIVVGVDSNGVTQGERWTGTQWEAIPLNPLATGVLTNRQGFAVAYEQTTGDAMLVWNDGATLQYATYTSQGWSAASTVVAYTGAEPQRLQIAAQPRGDQLLLTVSDANVNDRALIWNGTTWGHEVVLDPGGGDFAEQIALSPAYESVSGDATVFYGKTGDSAIYQRVFSNNAWGPELSVSLGISGQPVTIVTGSDPNSDRIGLAVMSNTGGLSRQDTLARWSGGAWEAITQINGASAVGGTTLGVAFESRSGDLLAAYIDGGSAPRLMTLTKNASSWSGPVTGPDMGSTISTMRLFADPASDHIMLGLQTTSGRLGILQWSGQSFEVIRNLTTDTGNAYTPAFTWFWQAQTDATAQTALWLGSGTTGTGWPGLNQVSNTEILTLDAQGLTLGANTSAGTFSHGWNPAAFGASSLDDMVWVSQPVALLNGVSFQRGDILFTVGATTSLNGTSSVTANNNDVVRFRPTVEGDYTRGGFAIVMSGLGAGTLGNGSTPDVEGLALVEQDVVVGGTTLRAGDFLFTAGHGSTGRDIYLQRFVTTPFVLLNVSSLLLTGNDLGISKGIAAIEVITAATALGGQSLAEGDLLITLEGADTIANNNLSVEARDVVVLTLSRSSVNGTATGTAQLLLDGSAMGSPNVMIDGLALIQAASPVITSGTNPTFNINRDENLQTVTTVQAQDSQGGSNVVYAIGGGADANMFTINAGGVLQFKSQNLPDFEAPTDANQDGVYEVLVTASEGAKTDQQLVRITIDDVNEAPQMASGTLNVSATELLAGVTTIAALDPEGQALTYSISGGADASYFQIDSSSGELRFSAAPDTHVAPFAAHALSYAVQVAASDGVNTSTRSVLVTLNKVNRPPVNTVPGALSTQEDTPLVLQGLAVYDEDAGSSPLTVTFTVNAGTLSLNTQVSGGVQANQVQVSNGGRTWVIQASSAAINATLSDSAGLTYVPGQDANGPDTLTMVTDDGGASGVAQQPERRSDTDTVDIQVQSVNDAPALTLNTGLSGSEGQTIALSNSALQVSDVDNPAADLSYSLALTPSHGHLALATSPQMALSGQNIFTQAQIDAGEVVYVHDGSEGAVDSLTLNVSDGAGGERTDITVQIAISPVNDTPVVTELDNITVAEGQIVTLLSSQLEAVDADNSSAALSYSITQAGAHGHLALVGTPQQALTGANAFTQAQVDAGQVIYVHDGSETSSDALVLSLSDGQGGQINGIALGVQVTPVNDDPSLVNHASIGVNEGQQVTLSANNLQTVDADDLPGALRYSITQGSAHGYLALIGTQQTPLAGLNAFTQAQVDAGQLIYVHDGSETLSDSLTLSVADAQGAHIDNITLQVQVQPVNDAPVVLVNSLRIDQGGTASPVIQVLDADTAPEQIQLTFSEVRAGRFIVIANGQTVDHASLADVQAGKIAFTQDGSADAPSYRLTVSDDGGNVTDSVVLATFTPDAVTISVGTSEPTLIAAAQDDEAVPDTPAKSSPEQTTAKASTTTVAPAIDSGWSPQMAMPIEPAPPLESLSDAVNTVTLQANSPLPHVQAPTPRNGPDGAQEQAEFTYRWTGSLQAGQANHELSRSLVDLRETLMDTGEGRDPLMASSIAVSTGLSVGYVIWLVRGGALVGSMLSSMPLWNMVDPLPVLSRAGGGARPSDQGDEGDASLENLFDGKGESPTEPPPPPPPLPPPAPALPAAPTLPDGLKDPT